MKRREALGKVGLGLSASILLPPWLAACIEEPTKLPIFSGKVVVIGAGAAGLYASDLLAAQGVNVEILEAGSYPGGRIRSLNAFDKPTESLLFNPDNALSNDFPIELGAERVYGSDSTWGVILNQQKIALTTLTENKNEYLLDGSLQVESDLINNDPDFNAALVFANGLQALSGSSLSAEGEINNAGISSRMSAILEGLVGNSNGSSNARIGVRSLGEGIPLRTRNNENRTLVTNPMQNALLSRFGKVSAKIKLNHVVTQVDYAGEKIIITGEDRTLESVVPFTIEADKVIVTVPVSILKAGDIGFNPALPASKIDALAKMKMDAAVRVFLDFKRNFWGLETGLIYGGQKGPEYFNTGVGRSRFSRTLSVTAYGTAAENLSALGYDAIPELLAELDSYFEGAASVNVRRDPTTDDLIGLVQDWTKQPFIRGGNSYLVPGATIGYRTVLGQPINKKLYFAGEATNDQGEAGTINGALASAERAVTELIAQLS